MLYFQVFQHKEKIADISSQASNEATLEQMLQKVHLIYTLQRNLPTFPQAQWLN